MKDPNNLSSLLVYIALIIKKHQNIEVLDFLQILHLDYFKINYLDITLLGETYT